MLIFFKSRFLMLFLFILFTVPLFRPGAENMGTLEFIDKPLEEILLVLASYAGVALMPDETVSGTSSFYYPGGNPSEALELFLAKNKLFLTKEDDLTVVSRVSLTSGDDGILILRTGGTSLDQLFRIIAGKLNITILHDPLSGQEYDLHIAGKNPGDLLSVIVSPLEGWKVSRNGDVYYIAGPGRDLPGIFSSPGFATVFLKNITGAELKASLPPGIDKNDLELTVSPHIVYLRGGEGPLEILKEQLEYLDKPRSQIRYDVLIMSFLKGSGFNWGSQFSASFPPEGGSAELLAGIGEALFLDFDILSTFGYQFVYSMDLALKESRARILADTTLRGLAGEDVRFFNSFTSRFRGEDDESTGPEGITVSAGTFLEIHGDLDGEEGITMDVKASQSSLDSGDELLSELPSSRERGFETVIRTVSGVPVIVGGFRQEEKTSWVKKIPLLGDIPLIGFLFKNIKSITEELETVIYIVPHLERLGLDDPGKLLPEYLKKYGGRF